MKKRLRYVSNSSVSSFCIMGVSIISTNEEGKIIDPNTNKVIFDISKHKEQMISSIEGAVKQRNIRKQPNYPEDYLFLETQEKWKEIFDGLSEDIKLYGGHEHFLGMYIDCLGEDETRSEFRHRVCLELQKIGYIGDESLIDIIEDTDE